MEVAGSEWVAGSMRSDLVGKRLGAGNNPESFFLGT